MKVSLALTHWNRFNMLVEAIAKVRDDPRISEVIISDDASDDGSFQRIIEEFGQEIGFRISRNAKRMDCYTNKRTAVYHARNPWVILFDSDNVLPWTYLDALERYEPWDRTHWYLPTFGQPDFDYRAFAGQSVDKSNIGEFIDREHFLTALNTANHFVHRDSYLQTWDPNTEPGTADSIFMCLRWLEQGGTLTFVPGMEYEHRIHDGSHFMTFNSRRYELFKAEVIQRLREL